MLVSTLVGGVRGSYGSWKALSLSGRLISTWAMLGIGKETAKCSISYWEEVMIEAL